MSFFGNCGSRHGVVIERCDPSVAARNHLQRGREAGRLPVCSTGRSRIVPRPLGVPPTEK
ncbi:hypothetical protein F7R21_21035 [Burkholderia latens]|uniref:Uncharacterized protein n=1 Tax=Burkholderia latens TaxID=488446 RepID=A0A6H9TIT1_9BURK|nr:hypothetical protein F7R21_21035 [Burkholderia latens]